MTDVDTSCKKCGAPMKPLPRRSGDVPLDHLTFITTGYRCDCGHWNDLKRRKPKKAQ